MLGHRLVVYAVSAAVAVSAASAEAQRHDHPEVEGSFLDRDGEWRGFEPSYDGWFGEDRFEPDLLRAAAWSTLLLAFGTAWYWAKADLNRLDWEFPSPGSRLTTDALRFDDNRFTTNHLLHVMSGAGYYGLSRVNGLGPPASFLVAFFASAFWEVVMEWRERISINDSIVTPIGGVALGEVFYAIGEYVTSAPGGGGVAQRAAAYSLGFPRTLHAQLDDADQPPSLPADELGFSSAFWHRFRIDLDVASLGNDAGGSAIVTGPTLEAEIVAVPGYLRPGDLELIFGNGNFTRARLSMRFDERGFEDIDLYVATILAGWFRQDLERGSGDALRGYSAAVGAEVAYRYRQHWRLERTDEHAIVHLLGPAADVRLPLGFAWLRARAAAHVDFAGVHSLAFEELDADGRVVKSLLPYRGYYYGVGGSAELELSIDVPGATLGGTLFYGGWDSVEGLDRRQELVTDDVSSDDRILEYRLWLSLGPPRGVFRLRVGIAELVHDSDMGDRSVTRRERTWTGSAGLEF